MSLFVRAWYVSEAPCDNPTFTKTWKLPKDPPARVHASLAKALDVIYQLEDNSYKKENAENILEWDYDLLTEEEEEDVSEHGYDGIFDNLMEQLCGNPVKNACGQIYTLQVMTYK